MKSWAGWIVRCVVAGWLCSAGLASAGGEINGEGAVAQSDATWALRSDGRVYTWGQGNNLLSTTVPNQNSGGSQTVVEVANHGNYYLLSDGTVFDTNQYAPVTGLSSVKKVVDNDLNGYTYVTPNWALTTTGLKSFVSPGQWFNASGPNILSTTLTLGGFALPGGVNVKSLVPSVSLANYLNTPITPNNPNGLTISCQNYLCSTSAVWIVGSDSNLYAGMSTLSALGLSNVAVPASGASSVNIQGKVQSVLDDQHGDVALVLTDGTVWATGLNIYTNGGFYNTNDGQIPPGGLSPTLVIGLSGITAQYVQIPGLTNISSLAVGGQGMTWPTAFYALDATGNVWAWGDDNFGQLGDNQNTNNSYSAFPLQIQGLTNVVKLATESGGSSVLALTLNGSVWAWGDNYDGQLGDGTNINKYAPVQIAGLSGVTSLNNGGSSGSSYGFNTSPNGTVTMPGGGHAVAITSDGSVWTWGSNTLGQLGDGTRISKNYPVKVLGDGGTGYLNTQPAVLDVLVGGVSIMHSSFNGFNFGSQAVNTTSAAQSMTFSNIGTASWTGFTMPPASPVPLGSGFAASSTCVSPLLPGTSCTMSMTFTPTAAGSFTVQLPLAQFGNANIAGGSGGPTLTGTGVGPQVALSSSLGFGTQKFATTTTKIVTLTNTGSATMTTVGTVGISGAGFTQTNTCGATLAAGASCAVSVTFAPTSPTTAYTGTLSFSGMVNPGGITSVALSGAGATVAAVRGDFNGDGYADIFWRDLTTGASSGQNVIGLMNGATLVSAAFTNSVGLSWSPVGISDFNGDGKADILWRNQQTGMNVVWGMSGVTVTSAAFLSSASPDWTVAGTGDFDGNGIHGDILWLNTITGQTAIWLTNNGQVTSAGLAGAIPAGWVVVGVGDFNGDGKSDILFRNPTTGANVIWFMNGTSVQSTGALINVNSSWSVKGVADFNGDGKADIFWEDSSGNTAVFLMNGSTLQSSALLVPVTGTTWVPVKFADFNGDGRTDILWRDASGNQAIWLMNGVTLPTGAGTTSVTTNWTVVGK